MLKLVLGGILSGFGLIMMLGFVLNGVWGMSQIVSSLLFGVCPAALGVALIRDYVISKHKALTARKQDEYFRREKEIIQLAQKQGGRLSIPDIVADTSMNSIEAEQVMREMTTKGYVDMHVTDSGVILYEFCIDQDDRIHLTCYAQDTIMPPWKSLEAHKHGLYN